MVGSRCGPLLDRAPEGSAAHHGAQGQAAPRSPPASLAPRSGPHCASAARPRREPPRSGPTHTAAAAVVSAGPPHAANFLFCPLIRGRISGTSAGQRGGHGRRFTWRTGRRARVSLLCAGDQPAAREGRPGPGLLVGTPRGRRPGAVPAPSRMRARERTVRQSWPRGSNCCRAVVPAVVVAPRRPGSRRGEERVVAPAEPVSIFLTLNPLHCIASPLCIALTKCNAMH